MSTTMRAAVCVRAGGPEVLEVRELPLPGVQEGWRLVQVKGAGLNRSELRTRQGGYPKRYIPARAKESMVESWQPRPIPSCLMGRPLRR